jgi:hypothetical protein
MAEVHIDIDPYRRGQAVVGDLIDVEDRGQRTAGDATTPSPLESDRLPLRTAERLEETTLVVNASPASATDPDGVVGGIPIAGVRECSLDLRGREASG